MIGSRGLVVEFAGMTLIECFLVAGLLINMFFTTALRADIRHMSNRLDGHDKEIKEIKESFKELNATVKRL